MERTKRNMCMKPVIGGESSPSSLPQEDTAEKRGCIRAAHRNEAVKACKQLDRAIWNAGTATAEVTRGEEDELFLRK